ncbi:hypothetical protein [Streptomyces sp. NBC_01185]|uniref:hypothetical protein n=1 Tax=Streptomyces sp. NBC_01185 TaxID=2903764 RepID=UPI003868A2F3|nr:hypothetical protein OG770_36760 [Streptomyces sp. NBC_01185]
MNIPLTGTTPPLQSDSPAPGWDQAGFRCGWCGARASALPPPRTATSRPPGAHRDAHAVWGRLDPAERDGIASILRTILSAPDLAAEFLALADGSR